MANYPVDANSNALFTTASFSNMSTRRPDRGVGSSRAYSSMIFESEAGYEKRRLRTRRGLRTYEITYSNIDGLMYYAIDNFYRQRGGEFDSFIFDLNHINESGNIVVRFSGPLKSTLNFSTGSNVLQNFYTVSFNLQETYD